MEKCRKIPQKPEKVKSKYPAYPRDSKGHFLKGNIGKPLGAKSKTTLLKEKILKECLSIDLRGNQKIKNGKYIITIPNIKRSELLKLGAGLIPHDIVKVDIDASQHLHITNIRNLIEDANSKHESSKNPKRTKVLETKSV